MSRKYDKCDKFGQCKMTFIGICEDKVKAVLFFPKRCNDREAIPLINLEPMIEDTREKNEAGQAATACFTTGIIASDSSFRQ